MAEQVPSFTSTNEAQEYGKAIDDPVVLMNLQIAREKLKAEADFYRSRAKDCAPGHDSLRVYYFNCASAKYTASQFLQEAISAYRAELQKELILQ